MQRIVSTLVVVLSLVGALTWACKSAGPTSPGATLKLSVPARVNVGDQTGLRLIGPAPGGGIEDDALLATWDVTPASVGRIDGAGVFTGLASGTATITATVHGNTATGTIHVLSPTDFHVSGVVRDGEGQLIPFATLGLVSANKAVFSTPNGAYSLPGILGPVTIRAQFAGAISDQTLDVEADVSNLDFTLTTIPGVLNLSGSWTATFSAPNACAASLPSGTAQRIYDLTVQQSSSPQPAFTFSSRVTFSPFAFFGTISGPALELPLPDFAYYGENDGGILERIAPGQWLDVSGTVTIPSITSQPASGTLTGAFDYYEVDPILTALPGLAQPKTHCAGTGTVVLARVASTSAVKRR
jgi:hypothetical protein